MEFSSSGVIDLPATSADSLERGDPRVLSWLREWIQEGDLINRSDPSYDTIERAQQYIVGEQLSAVDVTEEGGEAKSVELPADGYPDPGLLERLRVRSVN